MAYVVPSTRATGDLITASIWNTDNVENIKWLATGPYASASLSGSSSAGAWAAASVTSEAADGLTVSGTTFTAVRAGRYLFSAWASSSGVTAVARGVRIRHGGATTMTQDGTDTAARNYACSMLVGMAVGASVAAEFFSATGAETISGRLSAIWQRDL